MSNSWWDGTRLVAARALAEGFASRGWRVVTALMLVVGIAAVVLPRVISGGATTYTLATVGQAPASLVGQLGAAGRAGDFTMHYKAFGDDTSVRQAVRDGAADAGVVGSSTGTQVFVKRSLTGTLPALVSGVVRAEAITGALAKAGLSASQIAAVENVPPPKQVVVGPATDEKRAGVGFAVGLVLYLALIFAGTGIATTVATEKSTRISEVLLAVLRPTQLLVGTVVGVGLLSLIQIGVLAVPVGVSLGVSRNSVLPSGAAPDVALGVLWFVLGLALYAFVFAALAALVDKVTEVSSAVIPVNAILIGSYLLAVGFVVTSPQSWVSVVASLFPLSAPLVMPIRWASGLVPVWELGLSMLLTAAAAVLVARLASVVYRRGVVRTGRRVSLRDVLRT